MTHSKIAKIRKELIDQYGDRVLVNVVDRTTKKCMFQVKISNVTINNTADLTQIKRAIKENNPRTRVMDFPKPQKQEQNEGV